MPTTGIHASDIGFATEDFNPLKSSRYFLILDLPDRKASWEEGVSLMQFKDYQEILGVPRSATADDIRKAFRRLARKYRPDVSKEPDPTGTIRRWSLPLMWKTTWRFSRTLALR